MPLSRVQPLKYSSELTSKLIRFKNLFSDISTPAVDIFCSPSKAFRMRAEFRIWHQDERCFYAMFNQNDKKTPVEISEFSIASAIIQKKMVDLLKEIHLHELLKKKLFQVEFLSSTSGQLLITLIYHKALCEEWIALASKLEKKLDCFIIGRSKKQRIVISQDFITECLIVNQESYFYQQQENSFTQPNASVNQMMLQWACDNAKNLGNDLLELYCGNGNFTLPLSKHFNKVLATEMSKSGIYSAVKNQKINNINNIQLVRLQAEEVTQALQGVREFRRLKDIDLLSYNFSTVFVDPPRAGVDEKTLDLLKRFENIIYISCNPQTLRENIRHLEEEFSIYKIAVFDQFPYTDHLESGVLLTKNKK